MQVLLTGANRGIGLELCKLILEQRPEARVATIVRHPLTDEFKFLSEKHSGRLLTIEFDFQEQSVSLLRPKIDEIFKRISKLDLLINNAGILLEDEAPEQTVNNLELSFKINSIVPFYLSKVCLPYLHQSQNPKVVMISTKMASIKDNTSGGHYSYRASKAALNMLTKSMAIQYPEISFQLLHPGWVKTRMGGAEAPLTIQESARGLLKQILSETKFEADGFRDYAGQKISW